MEHLLRRVDAERAQAESIIAALQARIDGFGLPDAPVIPDYQSAKFVLERDPFSQQETLVCNFFASARYRSGHLLMHADGHVYGEYDVARIHPTMPNVFIEAVEAWGPVGHVKTDVRLLKMP